jgi:hypothetical protein
VRLPTVCTHLSSQAEPKELRSVRYLQESRSHGANLQRAHASGSTQLHLVNGVASKCSTPGSRIPALLSAIGRPACGHLVGQMRKRLRALSAEVGGGRVLSQILTNRAPITTALAADLNERGARSMQGAETMNVHPGANPVPAPCRCAQPVPQAEPRVLAVIATLLVRRCC